MSGRNRYTQQQVIDAIVQARGLKKPAAAALHCTRYTVTRYIQRYPAVRAAYEDALEATIDLAQSRLIALVEKDHWKAIHFILSTLGKSRGFTTRQEVVTVDEDYEARYARYLEEILKVYGEDGDDEE